MMTGFGDVLDNSQLANMQTNGNAETDTQSATNQRKKIFPRDNFQGLKKGFNAGSLMAEENLPKARLFPDKDPEQELRKDPFTLETALDSPRSTVSRASLPDSNSRVVLSALKELLDKLKILEDERDKARSEIEKLDRERNWMAFKPSLKATTTETIEAPANANSVTSASNKAPLLFDDSHGIANYRTDQVPVSVNSDPYIPVSQEASVFPNRPLENPRVTVNQSQGQSEVHTSSSWYRDLPVQQVHSVSASNSLRWPFASNSLPVHHGGATTGGIPRSVNPEYFNTNQSTFTSSGFGGGGTFGDRSETMPIYSRPAEAWAPKTVTTSKPIGVSSFEKGLQNSPDIAQVGLRFLQERPGNPTGLLPRTTEPYGNGDFLEDVHNPTTLATSVARSEDPLNPNRDHLDLLNADVIEVDEYGLPLPPHSRVPPTSAAASTALEVHMPQATTIPVEDMESSFQEYRHSNKVVEQQFRKAADRCDNLEQQLTSMQRIVQDHKKFNDSIAARKTRPRPGNTYRVPRSDPKHPDNSYTDSDSLSVTSRASKATFKKRNAQTDTSKSGNREEREHLRARPSSVIQMRSSSDLNRSSSLSRKAKDDSDLRRTRHVTFKPERPVSSQKGTNLRQRSKSLDKGSSRTKHENCGHYHAKFSELPFVCGTATGPSHSVNVNLQRVLSALKMHSSACSSATVTTALVDNIKPPSGKAQVPVRTKKPVKKRVTKSPVRDDSLSTFAARSKRCDFNSEKSMRELLSELKAELDDLAVKFAEITREKDKFPETPLAVELAREQMMLRKKMDVKQQQIETVEAHLMAFINSKVTARIARRSAKRKTVSAKPKAKAPSPKFDTSSELLKNMQKLQSSLRKDDVSWD